MFSEEKFIRRYMFNKATTTETILPLVIIEDLRKPTNRGLPIPPDIQLLICLRNCI